MDFDKRAKELENQIKLAFAARPYPGDDNLVEPLTLRDPDAVDLLVAVKDRTWREAADRVLTDWLSSTVNFYTVAGFRYYLPAYLIYLLDWPDDNVLGEAIFDSLRGDSGYPDLARRFEERIGGLTKQERNVIAQVLEFRVDCKDPIAEQVFASYREDQLLE